MTDSTRIGNPRAEVFDRLAGAWDSIAGPEAPARLAQVAAAASLRGGETVLDVGTGTGALLPALMALRPRCVLALDVSFEMLARVQSKFISNRVLPLLGDASRLPLPPASLNAILCNGVWPHLDSDSVAAELYRTAAPGACLVISHVVGRARVNAIHASASDEVLHGDLLAPGVQIAADLEHAGWRVSRIVDLPDLFQIIARK